ncbi:sulfate adenylyltransferase subunit CysN [Methanoregula formicica]|uniref:sulfate adenylyltransferase subunit CysN n=1 Tax=Methanoregula formicica TaxID=882104 RepID=UPI001F3A52AE|nr:sulfate adenylyltransferase subunit CysN [Methanoregula formicica]
MTTLEVLLERNEKNDLLRFATAGSVDDGKSTLIGRLLHDSKSVYEDQLDAIKQYSSKNRESKIDFSLFTDGLKSEREQGITIDVAYRYFSTPKRRFIIADTPGHEQYTRNMATGCSTSSLALILVDATKGIVTQTRRHSFISSLLGIKHFIVAINKMDLVSYSEEVYTRITDDFRAFSDKLPVESIQFIPISALNGDNVITRNGKMPWYQGPALLDYLETVNISTWRNLIDFRFPVQYVNWGGKGSGMRGYCGTIASGIIRPGEIIVVLPSGRESRVKKILTFEGDQAYAYAPQAVTLYLEDDIDISRGDMIVRKKNLPLLTRNIEANVVWMDLKPLEMGKTYLIKHTTHSVKATLRTIVYRFDPEDLHRKSAEVLNLNEIGRVTFSLMNPIYADTYMHNRQTGCFILIDPVSNLTAGAGMITRRQCRDDSVADNRRTTNRTYWIVGNYERAQEIYYRKKESGESCMFLDDALLAGGICADLCLPGQKNAWLSRVAHVCRAANASGVSVVVGSVHAPDDSVRNIIGMGKMDIVKI